MILFSSLTDTCNKKIVTDCGPACPSIDNLRNNQILGNAKSEDYVDSICKEL